jgi:hypothetical protein
MFKVEMFHVERGSQFRGGQELQSLPEAEAAEQRVKHILDPCSPGQPVEGRAGASKRFGDNDQLIPARSVLQRGPGVGDAVSLSAVERKLALRRQERPRLFDDGFVEVRQPRTCFRRYGN